MACDHSREPHGFRRPGVDVLRMKTGWRCRARAVTLSIVVIWVTLGCTPGVAFYGDQALLATLADRAEFEDDLQQAADNVGQRLAVEWDPSEELATAWLEAQLAQPRAPVVVLSPYFSLFASDFADTHASLRFIAFAGGGSARPNLTRVVFDRLPALENAGVLVRSWEDAAVDRKAAVLYLTNSEVRQTELLTLVSSHGGEGSEVLVVRRFDTPPDRETVRREIRDLRAEGVNAFLVFVGSSNRFALELLQSEPVVFATDFAASAVSLGDALLFSIEERLGTGLEAALSALDSGAGAALVTAPSVVEFGNGYENPQLRSGVPEAGEGERQDAP